MCLKTGTGVGAVFHFIRGIFHRDLQIENSMIMALGILRPHILYMLLQSDFYHFTNCQGIFSLYDSCVVKLKLLLPCIVWNIVNFSHLASKQTTPPPKLINTSSKVPVLHHSLETEHQNSYAGSSVTVLPLARSFWVC